MNLKVYLNGARPGGAGDAPIGIAGIGVSSSLSSGGGMIVVIEDFNKKLGYDNTYKTFVFWEVVLRSYLAKYRPYLHEYNYPRVY